MAAESSIGKAPREAPSLASVVKAIILESFITLVDLVFGLLIIVSLLAAVNSLNLIIPFFNQDEFYPLFAIAAIAWAVYRGADRLGDERTEVVPFDAETDFDEAIGAFINVVYKFTLIFLTAVLAMASYLIHPTLPVIVLFGFPIVDHWSVKGNRWYTPALLLTMVFVGLGMWAIVSAYTVFEFVGIVKQVPTFLDNVDSDTFVQPVKSGHGSIIDVARDAAHHQSFL